MVSKIFNGLFEHKWRRDWEQSERSIHAYYACKKTGDRKVLTGSGPGRGYQPVDIAWLQEGSGKYYIDGNMFDVNKDPSLANKKYPPKIPPRDRAPAAL